jgi:hypothetical protein
MRIVAVEAVPLAVSFRERSGSERVDEAQLRDLDARRR